MGGIFEFLAVVLIQSAVVWWRQHPEGEAKVVFFMTLQRLSLVINKSIVMLASRAKNKNIQVQQPGFAGGHPPNY